MYPNIEIYFNVNIDMFKIFLHLPSMEGKNPV